MATFQKPENALKRAEELIEVGKKQDALDTLHAAIQHRKFRNLWTTTIEQIMVRHLQLCVELKKMRTAREGLYQYRTMCQAANIGSLEHVVQKFRKAAEEKVNEAKAQKDVEMNDVGDLDEMEAPQTILLKAIQAQDTRQQSQDRDVHQHFRFLWDTYKVVLDVLKSNVRLEEVYHETARHAFEFCRSNQRPQEFKRLCEMLRKNYLELSKNSGKVPAHQVNPSNADTIMRTLETRCKQLQICTELDLWRESYLTATEIHEFMSKARPKPHLRSMYYEYLGQIFWKSENHLFHAFACLKNLQFVKAAKSNITKEELQLLASKAVLATLCVPFQKESDIHASLELTTEGASSPYEKAKKHATLFNAQSVPNRDSISQNLVEKGLLPLAAEPCKRLFALIESDFTPLSLCQDAKPFLDELAKGDIFDGKLVDYITPLKQIIFFRLMKQLSEVYANMTIENFEHAASIVPFSIAEKWMAQAARQHGINIQINYSQEAIVFGAPRKVDMKSMRQPLIEVGLKLQQAMQRVAPEEQHKKEKLEKQQLSQNIVKRIEEETKLIRQRKEEIERRKEESERRKEIQERELMAKQRKQEEREAELERVRQEEERIKREREREEQRRREQEIAKNKEMLAEMKKQADLSKGSNLKIEGKKITDIDTEDMTKLDPMKLMKAREAQIQRDRQEKIRQRKLESKRVDHLARALREEEQQLLDTWAEEVEDEDNTYLDKAEAKNVDEQRKKHEEGLKERDALMVYKRAKDGWASKLLEGRREKYQEESKERERRVTQKAVDLKIKRARKRMEEDEEDRAQQLAAKRAAEEKKRREREEEEERQEEERRREERRERERQEEEEREEEERRQAEEKQRQREARLKEREEEQERLKRMDEKRRQREEEIEARQKAEAEARPSARPAPGRREEGRREERRGGDDDDDGGNWRSALRRQDSTRDKEGDRGGDRGGAWGRGGDRDRDRDDRGDRGGAWGRGGDRGDRDRDDRDRDDREIRRPNNDREGWRSKGRDEEGGAWRKPAPAASDDKDDWRSGPRAAPTRGNTRDLGDRDRDREADDKAGPWRRGGNDGPTRDRDEKPAASAWGRGPPGGTARRPAAAAEDKGKDEGPWRRGGDRSSPGGAGGDRSSPGGAGGDRGGRAWDDDDDDKPARSSPAAKPPARKEEPAPAAAEEPPQEDEDGFTAVAGKKKKGKAAAAGGATPGGNAGDRRPTPPWKRR